MCKTNIFVGRNVGWEMNRHPRADAAHALRQVSGGDPSKPRQSVCGRLDGSRPAMATPSSLTRRRDDDVRGGGASLSTRFPGSRDWARSACAAIRDLPQSHTGKDPGSALSRLRRDRCPRMRVERAEHNSNDPHSRKPCSASEKQCGYPGSRAAIQSDSLLVTLHPGAE